jgi:hypothetical protein
MRMPRMKTYEAEIDGLHQWVVAAPSQRAALDAFGVHQDLFGQGLARVTDDPAATKAAQASPLTPLRRAKGSKAPFSPIEGGGLDVWKKAATAGAKSASAKPKPRSRARLDQAERALAEFEDRARADMAEIATARADLEAHEARLIERQTRDRIRLAEAVDRERQDYRR